MKAAVNVPTTLEPIELWDVGSYRYTLAHECRSDRYLERAKRQDARYHILDNGADELGEGMSGSEYSSLINEIDPDELILPDVLGNTDETQKRGLSFLEELDRPAGMKVMAVAQGLQFNEWMNCYTT